MAMTEAEKEAFKKRMAAGRAKAKASGTTAKKAAPKKKVAKKKVVKKAAPKKATAKPKAKKKVAATKTATGTHHHVITSAKVKANNKNFASAVTLATDVIYDAGKSGRSRPTWGQALRAAYGSGSLAGTARRKKAATKRKRTSTKK